MKLSCLFAVVLMTPAAYGQESPHGKLRFECNACHGTDSWAMKKDGSFRHESTDFVLAGQHKSLACVSCHKDLTFSKESSVCTSCHTDVHKSELGPDCLRCHTMQSWKISDMIQKHHLTRFPLLGRHATLVCQSCHTNASQNLYAGTPLDCYSCHQKDFLGSKAPNHPSAGFPTDCIQCHNVTAFVWATGFNHALTAFPLTGAHVSAPCNACHGNQVFKSTPSQCVSCHTNDYLAAINPPHAQTNFPRQCQICHTTVAWRPASFVHSATGFPLTGAHSAASCTLCHVNGNYSLSYQDCYQCHSAEFTRSVNLNHVTSQLSHDCTPCHTTTGWLPSTFNHDAGYFRIYSGRHNGSWNGNCSSCHPASGQFQVYTCTTSCHPQASMDNEHRGRSGYSYSSPACYGCHRNV